MNWHGKTVDVRALQSGDEILVRDGHGVKLARVEIVCEGHIKCRKLRGDGEWGGMSRVYFPNVVQPLLIVPENRPKPQEYSCPHCRGISIACTDMTPPIKRPGAVCLCCGCIFEITESSIQINEDGGVE